MSEARVVSGDEEIVPRHTEPLSALVEQRMTEAGIAPQLTGLSVSELKRKEGEVSRGVTAVAANRQLLVERNAKVHTVADAALADQSSQLAKAKRDHADMSLALTIAKLPRPLRWLVWRAVSSHRSLAKWRMPRERLVGELAVSKSRVKALADLHRVQQARAREKLARADHQYGDELADNSDVIAHYGWLLPQLSSAVQTRVALILNALASNEVSDEVANLLGVQPDSNASPAEREAFAALAEDVDRHVRQSRRLEPVLLVVDEEIDLTVSGSNEIDRQPPSLI